MSTPSLPFWANLARLHGIFQTASGCHNGQSSQTHGLHLHQTARFPPAQTLEGSHRAQAESSPKVLIDLYKATLCSIN